MQLTIVLSTLEFYKGQNKWAKTELIGPKSAKKTHSIQRNNLLREVILFLFKTSSDFLGWRCDRLFF